MVLSSSEFAPEHPLLADVDRFNEIADVMYAEIQKQLFPGRRRTRRPGYVSGQSGRTSLR